MRAPPAPKPVLPTRTPACTYSCPPCPFLLPPAARPPSPPFPRMELSPRALRLPPQWELSSEEQWVAWVSLGLISARPSKGLDRCRPLPDGKPASLLPACLPLAARLHDFQDSEICIACHRPPTPCLLFIQRPCWQQRRSSCSWRAARGGAGVLPGQCPARPAVGECPAAPLGGYLPASCPWRALTRHPRGCCPLDRRGVPGWRASLPRASAGAW